MKKIIAIVLTLTFALSFAACGKTEKKTETETTTRKIVETSTEEKTETLTEEKEEVTTEEKVEIIKDKQEISVEKPIDITAEVADENYFFNENNNIIEENNISIRPRYVYWENGYLVAECFVINGFDYTITQIEVDSFSISNHSGLIASASFGMINNVTLQPNEHVIWTFKYAPNAVFMSGANLGSLTCNFSCSYVY
jgi:SLAP domain-containing protein